MTRNFFMLLWRCFAPYNSELDRLFSHASKRSMNWTISLTTLAYLITQLSKALQEHSYEKLSIQWMFEAFECHETHRHDPWQKRFQSEPSQRNRQKRMRYFVPHPQRAAFFARKWSFYDAFENLFLISLRCRRSRDLMQFSDENFRDKTFTVNLVCEFQCK